MSNLTQTKVITPEVIQTFIEGHDPMERIVNITYSYQDDFVKIFYRNENDQKCVTKESYYPFVWATLSACQKLCNGDRNELKKLMATYSIGVKKLSNTNIHGEVIDEFNNGYLFMFFAKKPMKYGDFLNFFKLAKNPIYGKKNKDGKEVLRSNSESKQYLIVPPVEQFMISTGKRFFKGYDDYDQVYRMVFDLETEGLDPNRHRINQIGIRTNRGFEKIISVEGNNKEEKDVNELVAIDLILRTIYQYKPDVIAAHNGENFDWSFIITRCEKLGTSMQEMSSKYFDGDFIKKDDRESILKLGGEMEKFRRTIVPNTTITDSLHAVRRAQAIDSNFLKADLKYSTEYLEMKKPNRVYVPGDKISSTWNDTTNSYALNNSNGDWYCITENRPLKEGYDIVTGKYIVERYLLDDIWECDKVEHKLNTSNFLICKMLPLTFSKCTTMGTAGQWKALMMAWSYENDLAIPMFGESKPFTGGLSRLLKVGFVDDVAKFDYNSLYPSIILTWKISDRNDLMGAMLSFLEYVLTQREKFKKLKKQASKKAGAIEKEMDTLEKNSAKYNELNNEYLKYTSEENFYDKQQLPMKIFGNSFFGSYGAPNVFPWGSLKCAEQTTCTGRQMLRLMISHFSEISQRYNLNDEDYNYAPIVGDTDGFNFKLPKKYRYTKENPYIGKGLSRESTEGKEYTGFEADVAEFNDLYMRVKNGLGIDEIVSSTINFSRKNYADHFPEKSFPKDVKLVGNSIKSKKMQGYIAKFLEKGIRHLLRNNGSAFLEEYYDYIEKIYNYQIPLRDIASKGKIKKSIKEYLEDIKQITKAGRPKSRQAWYELAIRNNLKVDNGDTIYYINTGKSKSHADVKKITRWLINNTDLLSEGKTDISAKIEKEYKIYKKENKDNKNFLEKEEWIKINYPDVVKEEEIVMNCALVPQDILERDDDVFCNEDFEYNTAKYIDMFNKRITPLLVCFKKEIRDKILITNPSDRCYFTEEESKLSSGEPNKPTDQDSYEKLMTMEDKEIKFWTKYNITPPFIEECGMGKWEDIVKDYENRMIKEKELGIDIERETYNTIVNSLTKDEIYEFIEEGEVPKNIIKLFNLDPVTMEFKSKKYEEVVIGNIYDITDRLEYIDFDVSDDNEDNI
jgi:DNA polymerase elongation subunit (family B)